MAFRLYRTDDGTMPGWEYLPCSAVRPAVGLCMKLNGSTGKLVISDTPQYISMREEYANVIDGTVIPVMKIHADQVWETQLDGDCALKIGAAVDVSADGLLVDADSTADGVFLITEMEGTTAGCAVRGRFVK